MKNWHGLVRIIDVQHRNAEGVILFEQKDIYNLLHAEGEEFLLNAAFTGGTIPEYYYLGLDGRTTISAGDTMDDIVGEPSDGGYERQTVNSSGDFVSSFEGGHVILLSPIVTFQATSANWGPVSNLFLTDAADNSGYLISTTDLQSSISLVAGDSVTMRIGIQLKACTT